MLFYFPLMFALYQWSTVFTLFLNNQSFLGGGTMKIGFRSPYQNISAVLGKLSGFNLWSYQIKAEEIMRMSQGCGNEAGDVKAWETVSKGLTKEVEVKRHRSCRDRKGKFYLTSLIPPDRQQDSLEPVAKVLETPYRILA